MLTIEIPLAEGLDEKTREFVVVESVKLEMEHSLASLSKWEAKFEKPFLTTENKTSDELLEYIKMMTLTENVPGGVFLRLSQDNVQEIDNYIGRKMTATWFNEAPGKKPNPEIITAEVIYYWMFSAGIPLECENWHINRLFTLIKVFSEKNKPQKKMPKSEIASQYRSLNQQRRAARGSSG